MSFQSAKASRWQEAKEIVADALDLESEEARQLLVEQRCADDAELLAEVESLLGQSTTGFDASAEKRGAALRLRSTIVAGQLIGSYEIEGELGRGGMGAVYLARRADGVFDKHVAIKVLKRGTDTDEILRRFSTERRILARLEHSNIARLIDAGTTGDGLPYFVMEYVEGTPLTRFAAEHQLPLSARLSLFRVVCNAVSYAHRHLIVHRDLKPSNILVTAEREVKLLDFGIAKLIQEVDDAGTEVTATSFRVMTPEYASPEQLRGEPVTTQSDVYSLGIVLYELLTGARPHTFKTRATAEVAATIASREPERPSTVLRRRSASARVIEGKALRGDLDNIVLQALRLEPNRRYGSVNQLAEDLVRYAKGLPVRARPATAGYRAAKFIRRHKASVIAATAFALILVAATVVAALEARSARRQKHRAEERFDEVRQLAHSLLFDYYDKIASLGGSTAIRQHLVEDAVEHLDRLSVDAGDDERLLREVGAAYERLGKIQGNSYYNNLGDTAGAMRSYEKSAQIREHLVKLAGNSPVALQELANSYEGLGDIYYTKGDLEQGLTSYERAKRLREAVFKNSPSELNYLLSLTEIDRKIGDIKGVDGYANLGDPAGALAAYREAQALLEPAFAASPENRQLKSKLAHVLSRAGSLADTAGDIKSALQLGPEAVRLFEELRAADPTNQNYHSYLLAANAFLRFSLIDNNELTEAVARSKKVIAELEEMLDRDPNDASLRRNLGVTHNALGKDLLAIHDVDGALSEHAKALAIAQALAATNPKAEHFQADVAFTLARYGEAYAAAGEYDPALQCYRDSLEIRQSLLAANPANARTKDELGILYSDLAKLLSMKGNSREADDYYSKSIRVAQELSAQSPAHAKRAATLASRLLDAGKFHLDAGESETARRDLERSVAIWEQLRESGRLLPADATTAADAKSTLAAIR